uniref:RNA-binding protein n=1 Tax=Caenorhabditis tropicalis TaxID=1561998 RepID=A0A1I7TDM3_9PELO
MLTTSGYPNGASLSIDDSPQDQDESETFLLGMVTGDGLGKKKKGVELSLREHARLVSVCEKEIEIE